MDRSEEKNVFGENREPSDKVEEAKTAETEDESVEAEHVISYRDDESSDEASGGYELYRVEKSTPSGEYHISGRDVPKDEIPRYNAYHAAQIGNISYAPVKEKKEKKKTAGSAAGRIVLVAVCVLLSLGCGFVGAYFGNMMSGGDASNVIMGGADTEKDDNTVVVNRVVEHVVSSSDGSALTYSEVEALVGDSVVAITTEFKVVGFWQDYVTSGAGSGVIISEDGYIITNNHVITSEDTSSNPFGQTGGTSYADKITVRLKNGKEYEAKIVGGDADSDIAVIKITPDENESLVAAVFADSDKLVVGEEVIAIGNPLGELSGTTTNGIISALAREVTVGDVEMTLLQTNAAINPGNSGGGLFNMSGELVGVVNAKSSGTGIEGLGFAIPSNNALDIATQLIETGSVNKGTSDADVKIGITTIDVLTASDARKYGVNALGVYVYQLEEGYNDKVLKVGDRIIAVDGKEITSGEDVVKLVRSAKAGDKLEFMVYRSGSIKSLKVTVYANTADKDVDF